MNIPDWVSASVAIVALGGGLSGMYATMKSEDAVVMYQVQALSKEVAEGREYDGVLTEEIDRIRIELVTQDSTIQYLAASQNELSKGVKEIADAVNKMNEILIRQEERYAKKEDN